MSSMTLRIYLPSSPGTETPGYLRSNEGAITPQVVRSLNALEASLRYIEFESRRNIQLKADFQYPSWTRQFIRRMLPGRVR